MKKTNQLLGCLLLVISFTYASSADIVIQGMDPVSIGQGQTISVYNKNNVWNIYNNQAALGEMNLFTLGLSLHNYMGLYNGINALVGIGGRRGYGVVSAGVINYAPDADNKFSTVNYTSYLDWETSLTIPSTTEFHVNSFYTVFGYASQIRAINLLWGAGLKAVQDNIHDKGTIFCGDLNVIEKIQEDIFIGFNLHNIGGGINARVDTPFTIGLSSVL
ncbi:MAG TPA: hypothetical protein VKS21_08665, partial [Spirochaetota bacterium]|nr:hypothetical protein [Spirochaetota bacterium]